jgi:hypothetical protein
MNFARTFAVVAFTSIACGTTATNVVTLVPEVNRGPAAQEKPKKILSLTSTCGAMDARCTNGYRAAVDNIVRSSLEFAGYSVIDSESLRLATRQRTEEHTTTATTTNTTTTSQSTELIHPLIILPLLAKSEESTTNSATVTQTDTSFIVLTGSNFEDLSVDDRREVIEKSGAEGLLSVRIVIGGNTGAWQPNQAVEVAIKLSVKAGDEMVWASRCKANSLDMTTVQAALENATRCAMDGALGK